MTVTFTGRRPQNLCKYNKDAYTQFVKDLETLLTTEFINKGITDFISGGAQGFDQLAFWAVNNLKKKVACNITNKVYIPFKGFGSTWAPTGLFSQHELALINKYATETLVKDVTPKDKNQIVGLLMQRNHDMVDNADIVVALYSSDNWQNEKGGTAECIRYTRKQNKPVFQLKYEISNGKLNIVRCKWLGDKPEP